ncbi:MAG: hypothetical protein GWN87_01190 [Desulfuromonadales bacterium]|nr:hypothetical protein [Desulfuromonadales bacterium]
MTDVEVRFLSNGDWLNRWDSQARQGLPDAVSLTFATRVGTSEEVFRTIWQIGD